MNPSRSNRLAHVSVVLCLFLAACTASKPPAEIPAAEAPPPAPPPAAAPPPSPPAPTSEKVTLATDVFFDRGRAALKPEGVDRLEAIVKKAESLQLEVVVLVGYADADESKDRIAGRRLAVARAEAVKTYLAAAGLDPARVYTEGDDGARSGTDDTTVAGRARQRRVELEVVATRGDGRVAKSPLPRGIVPVLFGTTRATTGRADPSDFFGSTEADGPPETRLTLGRVLVHVPPNREHGTIKEPGYVAVAIEKVSRSSIARFIGVPPQTAANPLTDFSFASPIQLLTRAEFKSSLDEGIDHSRSKSALVYVHGFANSFKDAVFRTAQFSNDLTDESFDVVPVLFSWPSDTGRINYLAATDALESAGHQLSVFLDQLAEDAGIGVIHIVAHSKGAQVLTLALKEMSVNNLLAATPDSPPLVARFNQIVLAAPDIRVSDFGTLILPAVASHHRVTNYVASNDEALRFSKISNGVGRAGDARGGPQLVDGVETIDITAVDGGGIGHSGFGNSPRVMADIRAQLAGIVPSARGLQRVERADSGYWVLRACAGTAASPCERSPARR